MTSSLLNQEKGARNQYLIRLTFDFFSDISTLHYIEMASIDFLKEINAVDIMNF